MARLLPLAPLLLAACGAAAPPKGFPGTFAGVHQGDPVTMTLEVEGGRLLGAMHWRGVNAVVSGEVAGNRAHGTVRQPVMGVEVPFDATLEGDVIDWIYTYASGEKVPLRLTRTTDAEDRGTIDPRIVGRWTGAVLLVLNADGTFGRGTELGRWKCEGAVLHTRAEGGAWKPWGRYVLSGGDLTIYGPGESKQVFRKN
jgi:hypothetical protein